jgi:four helix bundle protein
MPRIKQRDKDLENQLRRAASSIGLNCAEAAMADPGNRRARLFTAAGSANETQHALRQAVAWRLVPAGDAQRTMRLVRRIVAYLEDDAGIGLASWVVLTHVRQIQVRIPFH